MKQKPVNARSTPVSSAGGERENKPEEKKKKPTENGEKKKEDASNNKSNETTSHETKSQKLANPLPKDNKNDANRLKSMFATAATKPKTQPNKTASSKPVSKPAVQKSFPAEEIGTLKNKCLSYQLMSRFISSKNNLVFNCDFRVKISESV